MQFCASCSSPICASFRVHAHLHARILAEPENNTRWHSASPGLTHIFAFIITNTHTHKCTNNIQNTQATQTSPIMMMKMMMLVIRMARSLPYRCMFLFRREIVRMQWSNMQQTHTLTLTLTHAFKYLLFFFLSTPLLDLVIYTILRHYCCAHSSQKICLHLYTKQYTQILFYVKSSAFYFRTTF